MVSGELGLPVSASQHSTESWRRRAVELLVVFAAYYIAGRLGQATGHIRSPSIGPVWPAHGVALAAVILLGPRIWPALLASAFLIALQNPVVPLAAAVQATGATLAALGGGWMLRRVGFDHTLSRLRDALNLVMLGGAASAMISATIGVAVLFATRQPTYSGILSSWLIYWLGDGTGVLLVTPLILTAPQFIEPRTWAQRAEGAAILLLFPVASILIFGDLLPFAARVHVFAFAVLPLILWPAIRLSMFRVALASAVIATIATVCTALGRGPFSQSGAFTDAVQLDVLFIILSVTGLVVAAVIAERTRAQAAHERLMVEQEALEGRLRLAAIVESSEDAIVGLHLDGTIADWNAGAEALYGRTAREAVGHYFLQLVAPDSAGVIGEPKDIVRRDALHRKKDGTRIPVALTISPIHDAAGSVVGESVIARDLTERMRANAMRDQLAHLGRVSLVSTLTGALAHEINQPLTAIGLNADMAAMMLAVDPVPLKELRDALQDIRKDNNRAGEVLQRVRTLLRKETTSYEAVDLNEAVAEVVKLVHGSAERRGIRVAMSLPAGTPAARGDRVQVQQVLLNLLMNACDAVQHNEPQFRRVSLRTLPVLEGVGVEVKDCGAGLSDDELARIFEPFYTTKQDGMGLGLSICRAIVSAHGGTLDASRNSDRGMTFRVAFPLWQQSAAREAVRRG